MRIFLILVCFLTYASVKSSEIIGLDSINLTNRIELVDIKINPYTHLFDTTIYYVAKYPTKSSENEYLIYEEKINKYILHQDDSVVYYNPIESNYNKYFNKIRHIAYYFSHLFVMLEDGKLFFSKIPTKQYQLEVNSFSYDSTSNTGIFTQEKEIGVVKTHTEFKLDYNFNQIEFEITSTINGEPDEFYYHQIFRPSYNDSLFKQYDDFYYNRRQSFLLNQTSAPKKHTVPNIEIGNELKTDYKLTGLNRDNATIDELFGNKPYLCIYNWGVWCGYCTCNLSSIKEFNRQDYDSLAFITINCESDRATDEEVKIYLERNEIEYPVYTNCDLLKQNGIYSYPMITIIDRNHKVIALKSGSVSEFSEYEEFLRDNKLIE